MTLSDLNEVISDSKRPGDETDPKRQSLTRPWGTARNVPFTNLWFPWFCPIYLLFLEVFLYIFPRIPTTGYTWAHVLPSSWNLPSVFHTKLLFLCWGPISAPLGKILPLSSWTFPAKCFKLNTTETKFNIFFLNVFTLPFLSQLQTLPICSQAQPTSNSAYLLKSSAYTLFPPKSILCAWSNNLTLPGILKTHSTLHWAKRAPIQGTHAQFYAILPRSLSPDSCATPAGELLNCCVRSSCTWDPRAPAVVRVHSVSKDDHLGAYLPIPISTAGFQSTPVLVSELNNGVCYIGVAWLTKVVYTQENFKHLIAEINDSTITELLFK